MAHQIVMWYSARMWTLWVLLVTPPMAAFITGGTALLNSWGWDEGNQSRAFASVVRRAIANGDHQGNDHNIGLDLGSGDPSHTCKLIDFRLCQRKRSEYNIEGLGAIVSVIFFT